ncbi:MAG: PIN domain-containing protein [Chloroflexaceae bacterium]
MYLDNCSLQRPLDDKSQVRVMLEAEAVLSVIGLSQQGAVELVHSDALRYEIERTPNLQRKLFAIESLQSATRHINFTERVIDRAKELEQSGIKPLDALHVASAEEAEATFFCTCDDRLVKRLKSLSALTVTVVTPLELIQEILP